MYDSHCHLHETDVMPHCDAIIARAKASGVTGFMLAGVSPEGWNAQLDIQERHPECAVSFGIHPQLIADASEQQLQDMLNDLARRLNSSAPPAAVGEIGLDRATPERKRRSEVGEWLFREQLALARELDLPIILHVLSAHGRAIELLRQDGLPRAGGVMHSYSGAPDLVPIYEALN